MDELNELIDPKTLTKDLKLDSTRTLEGWRRRGVGPPFIRVSPRAVRYRRKDVEDWLSARRVGAPTGDGEPCLRISRWPGGKSVSRPLPASGGIEVGSLCSWPWPDLAIGTNAVTA